MRRDEVYELEKKETTNYNSRPKLKVPKELKLPQLYIELI